MTRGGTMRYLILALLLIPNLLFAGETTVPDNLKKHFFPVAEHVLLCYPVKDQKDIVKGGFAYEATKMACATGDLDLFYNAQMKDILKKGWRLLQVIPDKDQMNIYYFEKK